MARPARLRGLRRGPEAAPDALGGLVDEWLFSIALTTSIVAVELCGA